MAPAVNKRALGSAMHLMYTLSPEGKRVYTLKKSVEGRVTLSAHPARFSPDDKMSRQRVTLKKRCVARARAPEPPRAAAVCFPGAALASPSHNPLPAPPAPPFARLPASTSSP